MKTSKWKQNEKTFVLLAVLILLAVVVGAFKPDKFYTMANFQSMSRQLAEIGIYALATFVIVVSGGLNMSIVAVANFSAICGGSVMQGMVLGNVIQDPTMRLIVGVVVSLIIGTLSGVINGYFVAGLGLTAVLFTSATRMLCQGMALVITKGNAIVGAPDAISSLGAESLFGTIPYLLILTVVCYAIAEFVFEKTAFGAQCRLLGANAVANRYSGNSNFKTLMKSYMLSGLFSSIGGIASYSRMCALRPDYGGADGRCMGGRRRRQGFEHFYFPVLHPDYFQRPNTGRRKQLYKKYPLGLDADCAAGFRNAADESPFQNAFQGLHKKIPRILKMRKHHNFEIDSGKLFIK